MRTVVEDVNNGQIIRNNDGLTFDVGKVEHTLKAHSVCEGAFGVDAVSGQVTEGYVYSSDYRMECLNGRINGSHDEIAYRFHGEHLEANTEVNGDFILVTNCGEYRIPFCIRIEEETFSSSVGPVTNLLHFTNLARARWDEALELFYSPGFEKMFTGEYGEYLTAYKCLSGRPGSGHNMDELLVTMHKKTPVEYIPAKKSIEINDPEGLSRFSLDITRNGWGHTYFVVESEGDFITLEADRVSYDSFLGNKYQLYYYIDESKLHTGHNFGSIIIKADRTLTVIPVTVNMTGSMQYLHNMTRFRHEQIVALMTLYSDHRLKKISAREWLDKSTEVVNKMIAHDPEDLMAGLYRIHLMITHEHINEAAWNLKALTRQAESIKDEHTYLWCYYLYLKSLTDEDTVDINTLTEEVEYYYKADPDSWRLCWLLSLMSDEYRYPERKWEMFKTAYERGCSSPAIYVEAARILLDNPAFVTELDGFTMAVIRYICKQDVLNEELIFAIRSVAERMKECPPPVVRLLEYCYMKHPDDDLLSVICVQLIKTNRTDAHAHKWYGTGVERAVKITRLYEYYMMSVDRSVQEEIPRPVLLYFSFQSDLDYEINAYLYAYVVSHKDEDADMYSRYLRQMKEYVVEQLKAGHNNRYLAIIYKDIIDSEMLSDESVAEGLANVIFMYEIDTSSHPKAKRVILCYEYRDGEESYPVKDGIAYVPIYSGEHRLAIEDEYGNRLCGTADVIKHQLIAPGRLLLDLQLMVKDNTGVDVHYCMEHFRNGEIRPETEFRFISLLKKGYFSESFAGQITMKLIRFYHERGKTEAMDKLISDITPDTILKSDMKECIRYLVKNGHYSKAMEWIYEYGPDSIGLAVLGELMYAWIPVCKDDPGQYEKLACQLLYETLDEGHATCVSTEFLMKHMDSSSDVLRDIWLKARELGTQSRDLEEKLLIQMLFTGTPVNERYDILRSYAYASPDKDVLSACLNMASYEYFVEDREGFENAVGVLSDAFETQIGLDRVCDLAYADFYAKHKDDIDDRIRGLLKNSLHRLLAADVVISCFKQLADFMPSMARFSDSVVIEYKTGSNRKVNIHYRMEDREEEYTVSQMAEVYSGVYSKLFVLFFGENFDYYITEEDEEGFEQVFASDHIVRHDPSSQQVSDRFGLIDDMCLNRTLKDYAAVDELMEEYYRKDFITNTVFDICS